MAYGVRNLRPQSVFGGFGDFDQITPDYGYQDNNDPIMDPIGQQEPAPYDPYNRQSEIETARTPSTPEPQTIEAPKVDPNSGMSLQDWFKAINEGYTPQTYARDRFNTMIDQFPERQQPSGAMRWAAGLQGISQVGRQGGNPAETVDKILSSEGNRAIDDWKTRIDPYHKAATLEGTANVQERTLAGNAVTGYMNDQRVRQQAERADQQYELGRQRNLIADYKARGFTQVNAPHSPTILMKDPQGNVVDTKIPSGAMNEAERVNSINTARVEAARQLGSNQQARQQNDPTGQILVDGIPHKYDPNAKNEDGTIGAWTPVPIRGRPTTAPPPVVSKPTTSGGGGRGAGATSELERKRVEQRTMENAWKTSKEGRSVIAKEGNTYTWKKRPEPREDTWWIPGDQSIPETAPLDYDENRKKFDPTYKPPVSGAAPPPPSGATPSATPSARPSGGRGMFDQESGVDDGGEDPRGYSRNAAPPPAGTIRMRAPDGSIRHVPAGRVAEAEKNGMRRLR